MTRIMYDGVTPASVPAGAALYAGYNQGRYQSLAGLEAKFPTALHVSICVQANGDARVLDVESGDATPQQAPGWVVRQRAGGNPYPVVYCNQENGWAAVRQAFADQAVPEPLYWVANYVNDPAEPPAIPAGAIAIQYYDYGGYDASIVADYWPGVDPAQAPPTPAPTTILQEVPVQIEPLSVHPGDYAVACDPDPTRLVLVADGNNGAPAQLRVAVWVGDAPQVTTFAVGGSGHHTLGHTLPAGTTGVTIQRQDDGAFAVGIALR